MHTRQRQVESTAVAESKAIEVLGDELNNCALSLLDLARGEGAAALARREAAENLLAKLAARALPPASDV